MLENVNDVWLHVGQSLLEDIRDGVLEGTEGVLSVLGELRGGISDGGTMGSSAQAGLESAGCLLQRLSNSAHQLLDSLDMRLEEVGETGPEGTEGVSEGASLGSWVVRQDLSEKGGEICHKLILEIVRNGVVGSYDLVNFLDELRGWHGGELRGESLELGEGLGVHSVHVVHLLLDNALGGISQRFHLLEEITQRSLGSGGGVCGSLGAESIHGSHQQTLKSLGSKL